MLLQEPCSQWIHLQKIGSPPGKALKRALTEDQVSTLQNWAAEAWSRNSQETPNLVKWAHKVAEIVWSFRV